MKRLFSNPPLWLLTLLTAGVLAAFGSTIYDLRSVVLQSATVAVQQPLWI